MSEFFRRLRYLIHRGRYDRELANDMEFHREMASCEGGVNFGNTLRLREEARETWGWMWIDRLSQDLRYATRMLRKSPGFTFTAILMLALGIGVNVAVFGFFNLMVLRPLPVRDPATLVKFQRSARGNFTDNLPYAAAAFYRANARTLSALLAVNYGKLTIDDQDKQLQAHFVTENFFAELGGTAAAGRVLDPAQDAKSGAEPVVVLGYRFWQLHFAEDPSIVGKTIRLNSKPVTVAGVASREFSGLGLESPDLWVPITQRTYLIPGSGLLTDFSDNGPGVLMWGRLGPGVTPKIAETELASLAAELRLQHPKDIWENESLPSEPGGYALTMRGEMYPMLALAAALCLLILAVSCGNLGSLLLARGVAREREIAIRVSVGAGRTRLIRQLFTESVLLALLGAAAGMVLANPVLRGLMAWVEAPAWLNPAPDWRVVTFAVAMGFGAAILFGLAPALQSSRQKHRSSTTRQILMSAQVAASCVLLIVAGLLVRALSRATRAYPGFDYQQVISIDPHMDGYTPAAARTYLDTLRDRLRALPGVESVSMASNPPLGNRWTVLATTVAGRAVNVHFNSVDPAFFETMRIPILRGRSLSAREPKSIIVSESLARLRWPAEDPIGKPFRIGADGPGASDFTVAGVSGSARLVSPEDSDAAEVYQFPDPGGMAVMVVLVRTFTPPESLVQAIASTTKSIDPKLFPEVKLMKAAFQQRVKNAAYTALAVGVLGFMALLLACLGIVGLVAYAVTQRTKEIGIRMALGARPAHVLSVVLRQILLPSSIGLLIGVGASAALSQILRRLLFGVSNLDPSAYAGAVAVFVIAAALAALLPARQALGVDPMRALRYD